MEAATRLMGKTTGFLEFERELPRRRAVPVRLKDWREVYEPFPIEHTRTQASRCMDCGIPFCNNGCPLGNLIPEWNDLVYRDHWREAIDRLHATNNFPEFTGRLCPAPCEAACVLGINADPVTIKQVEVEIIDRAFSEGWVRPLVPSVRTGKSVAVVGSGPAGLAAAQQLDPGRARRRRVRAGRPHRRPAALRHPRVQDGEAPPRPPPRPDAGRGHRVPRVDRTSASTSRADELREQFDAVVLAGGRDRRPDLPIPGHELDGIHQAMEYLPLANRVQQGDLDASPISAAGKRVVIIGGGDTGADCLGTAHRQGAASVAPVRDHAPAARRAGRVDAVADLAADDAHVVGPRGGRRAGLLRHHHRVPRRGRPGQRAARPRGREPRRRRAPDLRAGRGHRLRAARASWCCWPWASSALRPRACSPISASS